MQIRVGLAAAAAVLLVVLVTALAPDPLMRQRLYVTAVDNVDAVSAGVPVAFAGGTVGKVRWVRLDPVRNVYAVGLGLRRDWTPPACAFVHVAAINPLAAPKIEVVAPPLGAPLAPAACAAFRQASGCTPLAAPADARRPLEGCLRQGDLTQLAAAALTQATQTLAQGGVLLARLETMTGGLGKPGNKGPGLDFAALARNVTETTGSVNAIAAKLNGTLTAQRQADLGAAIGNLRTVSNHAAAFDTAQVQATVVRTNALLQQMTSLLEENRASVQALATQGAGLTTDSRELLSSMQAGLVTASGNLERASANLDALSERMKGDPGYVLRGARYADPPKPGAPR